MRLKALELCGRAEFLCRKKSRITSYTYVRCGFLTAKCLNKLLKHDPIHLRNDVFGLLNPKNYVSLQSETTKTYFAL